MKIFKGMMNAEGGKFRIICSRFNELVAQQLLEGAIDTLIRHGGSKNDIGIIWVPGAFEVPYAAMKLAKQGGMDAVICLGAVIRGDTPHFDYIASESAKGIAQASLSSGIPVIYGIITADTMEQAVERSGSKAGNKGRDGAMSAIEMVNLYRELDKNGAEKKSS